MSAVSGRLAAVQAIRRLNEQNAYSNLLVNNLLQTGEWDPKERALATALIYGTVEHRLTLDFLLSSCSSKSLKRLHPAVLAILQTAAYQLVYMDKVPDSAAVNEAVKLTKLMGQQAASGFVNAVLRAVARRYRELLDGLGDSDRDLSLRYSCPVDWIKFWQKAYGREKMLAILAHINDEPPTYLRVNTLKTDARIVAARLIEMGATVEELSEPVGCLKVSGFFAGNLLEIDEEICYYYQDKASQLACAALGVQAGQRVADVCAAPGGKSLTIAQYLRGDGEIVAGDIYAKKCEIIRNRAAQMGVANITVVRRDASLPCPDEWMGTFDRVLCDVPCSGLGVIRRKPEIRYKTPSEFADLPALQYRILTASAAMVKKGGWLQYSTCTLNPAENEEVVKRFLQENPDFSPRILPLPQAFAAAERKPHWHITLFPHQQETDGFFIAGFERTV
ncbi:MAG: 16S rRNA (cytosine(967)-C(5))-methyltransferase RsmB [Clostridia bacterium]|nr:16S rRNA (cytosine(967)-C(5))-methyltransferase RsmB [Clostridia bacterium]